MKLRPVTDAPPPRYPRRQRTGAARVALHAAGVSVVVVASLSSCATTACVTVCPPVYIAEEEALEVIREVFAEHGMFLSAPGDASWEALGLPFAPDLASVRRAVAVEFVSKEESTEAAYRYGELVKSDPSGDEQSAKTVALRLWEAVESLEIAPDFVSLSYPSNCEGQDVAESLAWDAERYAEDLVAR